MSKKLLTIIIGVSVLSLLVGVGTLMLKKSNPGNTSTQTEGGGLSFREFFTIGGKKEEVPVNEIPTEEGEVPVDNTDNGPKVIPKLQQISFEPTTGYGTLVREREIVAEAEMATLPETTPAKPTPVAPKKFESIDSVRYQDKATGHVYQTYLDIVSAEKISNTTIPKVHRSFFVSKSEGLLDQYLTGSQNSIETYHGTLTKDTEGNYTSLTGIFLPKNILDIAIAPDTTKIFYLSSLENGVVGTISSPKGESKIQVFSSKFSEWLSQYANSKLVTVTTKPSARSLGYMYGIDTSIKSFDKILGGITGLTTLTSPDGKQVLYSATNTGGFSLNIYNIATKKALTLGLTTLPEKCVWAGDSRSVYCAVPQTISTGEYPDAWYQGIVSFNDSFWKLDTETNIFELVYDSATEGKNFDGINLQLSNTAKYLLFMNKVDNQLWGIKI
ncbi:MAG: hypothetical protein KBC42_03300 [Candidatus Pacebacteria bacterium]|nr:hypothetical protein [Candidatus Paceibacterota bacterium]MBP9780923.1 hypothetical protein [Candidatus Paceibacterota bacterium]